MIDAGAQYIFKCMGLIERLSALAQGRGYGAGTVSQEVRLVLRLMRTAPRLAVDIGGNIGDYSAALRKKNPKLEIHVFEPSATNVVKLRHRFADDVNITIVPVAVSDESGLGTLYSDRPGSSLSSLTKRKLDHFNIEFQRQEAIRVIRFEDYWGDALKERHLDIVKIDVEGHEFATLSGFGRALTAVRVLQFEFGGCNIDSRTYFQDFWYFFKNHGFSLLRITPLGFAKIDRYRESDEFFSTTNYIAVNRRVF